jgi:deazaflavin-dependent oxidoreductase (nitroreductase family)
MVRRIPRWLARAPIPLYRHGLGRLLGSRMVMLEHQGRHTGQPRYVILEVIDHPPGHIRVVSGYGNRSQWYRNLQAHPHVRVWTGPLAACPAHATVLSPEQGRSVLETYRAQHQRAARTLGRTLGIDDLTRGTPLPATITSRLPVVDLTLTSALVATPDRNT